MISAPKTSYHPGETIVVSYSFGPGNAKDWIGIYEKGDTPGNGASTQWKYVNGASGQLSFNGSGNPLASGVEYFAGFFENDSYTEIASRVPFYVGSTPTLTGDTFYDEGDTVTIAHANADVPTPRNRIAIYKAGDDPKVTLPITTQELTAASGSWDITTLGKAYYFAVVHANNGTLEISDRFNFSVGDRIAELTLESATFTHDDAIQVTYTGGPTNPKDYVGVFIQGEEPGVGELVTYIYVDGLADNTITIPGGIDAGDYYTSLLTNDSYTEVSNRVNFTIKPKVFEVNSFQKNSSNDGATLSWATTNDVEYTLQKSTNMVQWIDVQTLVGTGTDESFNVAFDQLSKRCFYRVVTK
mgnify:CR=1 FL=1